MSSGRSPDLRLELATDWRVVSGLLLWVTVTVGAAWQADLSLVALIIVTLALLGLGLPIVASQFFGLRPGSGARLVWSAEGRWHCELPHGSSEELELSARSRVFPGGALLVFRRARTLPWVLLLQHGRANEGLRRLCGRLRLDKSRLGSAGRQTAGAAGDSRPQSRRGAKPEAGN